MQMFMNEMQGLAFLVITLFYMYVCRFFLNTIGGVNANDAIVQDENLAVALRRSGFYIALGIGMLGSVSGHSRGFLDDIFVFALDGCLVTIFLLVALWVNDYFVLPRIDNTMEIKNGNVAVGIVECCGYLATGFIAYASFSGKGGGVFSAIVFFALGQTILVLLTKAYEAVSKTDMVGQIDRGNNAAAIMVGGQMVAIGIILMGGITGDFTNWYVDLFSFFWSAFKGIVLLFLLELVVDRVFLPKSRLVEQIALRNVAVVTFGNAVRIGVAITLVGAVV